MISVCLATYNGEKFIEEQILSILGQLGKADEIIISDDGSTDDTRRIIHKIQDDRIQFYLNTENRGVLGNFENALNHCKGDYVFLSDQDDVWCENKVNFFLKKFKDGYDVILSDARVVDIQKNTINDSYFSIVNSKLGMTRNIVKNSYLGCCMAFHRKVLKHVLPIPKEIVMHDIWIGLIGELLYRPILINEKLLLYRRHSSNCSPSAEKSTHSIYFKLSYRIVLLKEIIRRVGLRVFLKKFLTCK